MGWSGKDGLCALEAIELPIHCGLDFIGFDEELPIRREVDRFLRENDVAVNQTLHFDNLQMIKEAVAIGSGVSIVRHGCCSRRSKWGGSWPCRWWLRDWSARWVLFTGGGRILIGRRRRFWICCRRPRRGFDACSPGM